MKAKEESVRKLMQVVFDAMIISLFGPDTLHAQMTLRSFAMLSILRMRRKYRFRFRSVNKSG